MQPFSQDSTCWFDWGCGIIIPESALQKYFQRVRKHSKLRGPWKASCGRGHINWHFKEARDSVEMSRGCIPDILSAGDVLFSGTKLGNKMPNVGPASLLSMTIFKMCDLYHVSYRVVLYVFCTPSFNFQFPLTLPNPCTFLQTIQHITVFLHNI